MKDKKILFTDLDNTLLNTNKEITKGNVIAIEKALKAGHQIVVNTGRPLVSAMPTIRELNLEQQGCYASAYNGGLLYNCYTKEIIFKESLPHSYVEYIFQQAKNHDLYCQTYDSTHLIAPYTSPCLDYYVSHNKLPYRIEPQCPDSLIEDPVKVLVIDFDREKLDAYREDMQDWAENKVDIFYSSPIYLEHVKTGVSKGVSLKKLCDLLNIPVEHSVAAGDAENDIPMLEAAGVAAAMCNGEDSVKAAADYVTTNDCNHDGVAEIIEKFIL